MRLFPMGETEGDGAGVPIKGGTFSLPEDSGLTSGGYRVSIIGIRKTGRKIRNQEHRPGDPKTFDETVQYIPQRYNVRTELQVQLQAGPNEKDFELGGN